MHVNFQNFSLGEAITILKQRDVKIVIDNEASLDQLVAWLQSLKDLRYAVEQVKHVVGQVDL